MLSCLREAFKKEKSVTFFTLDRSTLHFFFQKHGLNGLILHFKSFFFCFSLHYPENRGGGGSDPNVKNVTLFSFFFFEGFPKKYAVKLFAVYWYCVHTRSFLNYVLSLPIPNFRFKMFTSEMLYETESSFEIMLSELKIGGK